MPRKPAQQVIVDPVAAAAQLEGTREKSPEDQTPGGGVPSDSSKCALGHENELGARFCGSCGLPMDAQLAPPVDPDAARPKPAAMLSADERAERERQHTAALAASRQLENAPVNYVPSEGAAVTIHFVEDGFTFAGVVWMRGQTITLGPGHPRWDRARSWILLDVHEQVQRYGKQYFAPGPWPYPTTYADGADSFERLGSIDGSGTFAGPGEDALRQAAEAERRRGGAVPAPLA